MDKSTTEQPISEYQKIFNQSERQLMQDVFGSLITWFQKSGDREQFIEGLHYHIQQLTAIVQQFTCEQNHEFLLALEMQKKSASSKELVEWLDEHLSKQQFAVGSLLKASIENQQDCEIIIADFAKRAGYG